MAVLNIMTPGYTIGGMGTQFVSNPFLAAISTGGS